VEEQLYVSTKLKAVESCSSKSPNIYKRRGRGIYRICCADSFSKIETHLERYIGSAIQIPPSQARLCPVSVRRRGD